MAAIKYKLVITKPARMDVTRISNYSRIHWGDKQAAKYVGDLYKTITTQILENPSIGRKHYGVTAPVLGYKSGSHIIFYRVAEDEINILRILHESMAHEQHIEE